MKKKILSIFLCFAMLLAVIPMSAFAAEETARTVVDSGFCGAEGENLTWTLYDDGEIVISGEGEMKFYRISKKTLEISSPLVPPWYAHFADIRVITVEEGVTGIGNDAFYVSPMQYHRVNLPKSLEYYYAFSFAGTHADGSVLVCCYAGTDAEWSKVERRSWSSLRLNEENTEVVEIEHRNPSSGYIGYNTYYDGTEPEIYCNLTNNNSGSKLEKGETAEINVRYYKGEQTDAKLVWKTEGDSCSIEYTKHSESGVPIRAKITSVTHGDFSVIAEIVAPDGTVLCSDRINFESYVPEDMTPEEKEQEEKEKRKKEFEMMLAEMQLLGLFTFVYGVIAPIATVVLSPYYAYLTIKAIIDWAADEPG